MMNTNWETKNHTQAKTILENYLAEQKLPHAILIHGASGTGKTRLLQEFIEKLKTQAKSVELKSYLDTESLKIETIRDLIEHCNLSSPHEFNLILIKNIERLTLPAANALLKTLEEPTSKVHFLLTSSALDKLPPTIISRCQLIRTHEQAEQQSVQTNIQEEILNKLSNHHPVPRLQAGLALSDLPRPEAISLLNQHLKIARTQFQANPTVEKSNNLRKIRQAILQLEQNCHQGLVATNLTI